MVRLVPLFQTTENGYRRGLVRLIDHHFLEPALERLVGLEVFLILVQRRRTDRPQVTTCQRRFEDVGCVHRAGALSCAYERVYLINKEDDLARGSDHFVHHAFESLLELTLVLGTGDQRTHIQGVDLFLLQVLRHISAHDSVRQPFRNRCLTHTRFTNQNRVVLRTPRQDLQHTSDLIVPPDDGIQFAFPRPLTEVDRELVQVLILVVLIRCIHSRILFWLIIFVSLTR